MAPARAREESSVSRATELAGYTSTSESLPCAVSPRQLLYNDFWLILKNFKHIPGIVWPLWAGRSNSLNELSFNWKNFRGWTFHFCLIVLQLGFLFSFPLFLLLPTSTSLAYFLGFITLNYLLCCSFNGQGDKEFVRHPFGDPANCAPNTNTERWVFINGVAAGENWLNDNLQLLANTFRRTIIGVHNPTAGIIFDVIQCLIERDFNYNVSDVRQGFAYLKKQLMQDEKKVSKIVLILHSQGGIEGGMIVDWLLADLPENKLSKLEVYTFGSAANHFNNPIRLSLSDFKGDDNLWIRMANRTRSVEGRNYYRAIPHIEHYANTGDFVARFGVLNFTTKQNTHAKVRGNVPQAGFIGIIVREVRDVAVRYGFLTSKARGKQAIDHRRYAKEETENRFAGIVFQREGSGHMLNEHYLSNMFTFGPDGKVAESNQFMDSVAKVDNEYYNNNPEKLAGLRNGGDVTVKSLSRLWQYRNGRSPEGY